MNSKFKKIMGICLSMVLAFSVTLPAYAEPICGFGCLDDYEFDKTTGHLFIGKEIEDKSIASFIYSFCVKPFSLEDVKSVTIKDGVTKIGEKAFNKCHNLTEVEIPDSVTSIDRGSFSGCTNLTSVTIPNSVTEIGAFAFSDCSSLTSITIPNSETKIYQSAFDGCTNLETVTVGNKVYNMGE